MLNARNYWVQLGLVAVAFVIFSPKSSAQTISCSSDDGHRHYCRQIHGVVCDFWSSAAAPAATRANAGVLIAEACGSIVAAGLISLSMRISTRGRPRAAQAHFHARLTTGIGITAVPIPEAEFGWCNSVASLLAGRVTAGARMEKAFG